MIHCFWNIIIHCFWNIIIERNCNAQKMGVQWVHWESSSVLMKIDLAPPPGHRSGGRRSRTALIWLLHLPVTAQEGRGQIDLAPPPHLRGSLLHGDWEVEQPCFLVGNNQLTSPTPYTPYYYRPELVMTRAGNGEEMKRAADEILLFTKDSRSRSSSGNYLHGQSTFLLQTENGEMKP